MAFGSVKKLFVELGLQNRQFTSGLKDSETKAKQASARIGSSFKRMATGIAAGFSVVALKRFFTAAVKAAGVQEQAEKSLADALKVTGQYTDANFEKLKSLASGIQQVSTVGDEAALNLMQMATSMGVQADQLDTATKYAIGLSQAYGINLNSALKMVATGMKGDYNLMQRYIPQIRGVKDEVEKAAIAQKAMADAWEVAKGKAETFPGKIEQLKNAFGDMTEQVGKGITESEDFNATLDEMKELFADPNFQKGIAEIATKLAKVLSVVVQLVAAIPQLLSGLKELGAVEEQQIGVISRSADQTALLQKRLHDFLTEVGAGKDVRHQMLADFANIEDQAAKYNAIMLAIKKGKYGDEMADQFKKWYAEQKKAVEETEKQIKQGPELQRAEDQAARGIRTKTSALEDETKATEDDTKATEDFLDILESMPGVTKDYADIAWELGKDAIPTLTDATDDFSDGLVVQKRKTGEAADEAAELWQELSKVERAFNMATGVMEAFGIETRNLLQAKEYIKGITQALASGDWLGVLGGVVSMMPIVVDAFKQIFNTGVSQSQVARRAIEAFGDSVYLSADTIRALGEAMKEAGITEYGKAAKEFADEWLRANGYMDDLIEKSRQFRKEWVESGGKGRDTGRDPGGDREYGRDLPGLEPPPEGMPSRPHISADSGFYSSSLPQDTLIQAHQGEAVSVTPSGQTTTASIHIHNAAGAYTSRDFVRDLKIGRFNREITDALRVAK